MNIRQNMITLLTVLFLILTNVTNIETLSMSVSRSADSVKPGSNVTFSITPPNGYVADVSYSVSNGAIVKTDGNACVNGACSLASGQTGSVTVKANSSGNVSISVSGEASALEGENYGKLIAVSGRNSVSIVAPSKPKPAPTPTSPKPAPKPAAPKPSPKPSAPQKTEEELRKEAEARKKAKEEEKKREEEARKRKEEEKKEKEKKTPLFSSFDIISQSDKRFGEVLDTIPTKFNVFEYEFQLPKNIDRFTLDFEKIADGVILDFEKEHQFTEDQQEIVVPVKASKGDINQNFSIKVKKDNTPVIKRKVDDKEMTVFDDELLDGFLEKYGFDRKTVGEAKDQSFYFEKGQLRLQLLIDDKFNGQWYLLNEKNELLHPVTLLKLEKDLLVTFKAPEEYHQKTIDEERYEKRDMEVDRSYYEIYKNLNVNQSYHSWLVEDGEIVYGMDSSGEEGLYYVSALKDDMYHVEKAFVGFDSIDTKTQKLAMVSGFGFLGLASANAANYYKKKRRRV